VCKCEINILYTPVEYYTRITYL